MTLIVDHAPACKRGWINDAALGCNACLVEARLRKAVAGQKHYPCRCHDWVYVGVDEGWHLVRRPD